ncbi:hypothetical protein P7K49_000236 [Saguinus oedipus]|uniref:Uncharacterized protein n=1 Tax=Saguinus oedipus TaxID=9490 RepID=A0ABQ9WB16_SAGOE|nr:hypothetical protein P7K49_000236 [Saguinus oedipus]
MDAQRKVDKKEEEEEAEKGCESSDVAEKRPEDKHMGGGEPRMGGLEWRELAEMYTKKLRQPSLKTCSVPGPDEALDTLGLGEAQSPGKADGATPCSDGALCTLQSGFSSLWGLQWGTLDTSEWVFIPVKVELEFAIATAPAAPWCPLSGLNLCSSSLETNDCKPIKPTLTELQNATPCHWLRS